MSVPPPDDKMTRKSPRASGETQKPVEREARETVGEQKTSTWSTGPSQQPVARTHIGRFAIRRFLGEGAFAVVYSGFDSELEREVAIKVPKAEELTPEARELFLRENRLAAIIHHPNICPVYEVGTDNGLPYIVMRMVPDTLKGLLKRLTGPMPPRTALAATRKLALGLVAAHAQKVIHRDLKPANILYDDANREVLIADFGLARFVDQSSESSKGVTKGTPAYMSPEQARGLGNEVGPLSDVYSLGVILYELLTGRVPFSGSVWEVLRDHCETTPPLPSVVRPGLDPRLDDLCLKAMAKRPAERYSSAKVFAAAIGDYLRSAEQTDAGAPVTGSASKNSPLPAGSKIVEKKAPPQPEQKPEVFDLPAPEPAPVPQKNTAPIEFVAGPSTSPESDLTRRRFRGAKIVALLMVLLCAGAGLVILLKPTPEVVQTTKPTGAPESKDEPVVIAPEPKPKEPEPKPKEPEPKPKEPEPKTDAKKLLGKWMRQSAGKGLPVWEFTSSGNLIMSTNNLTGAGGALPIPHAYTLDGDKLSYDPGSKGKGVLNKITFRVIKLTEDELELIPANGATMTFTKMKPR